MTHATCHQQGTVFLMALLFVVGLGPGCQSTEKPPISEKGVEPGASSREKGLMMLADQRMAALRQSGLIVHEDAVNRYVETLGDRVLPDRVQSKIPFTFYLLRHPVPNAFAMPNGAIVLHTGLVSRLTNEAQLAMILAHEAVHVIERHSLEHLASLENKLGTLQWVSVLTAPAGDVGALTYNLGRLVTVAAVFGFSRDLEREADRKGFEYLVKAGYDGDQAADVFRLLNLQLDEEREPPPYLYATHPRNRERRTYLDEKAHETDTVNGVKHRERFLRRTKSVRLRNARRNLNRGWPRTARHELKLVLLEQPRHPEALFLKARSYADQKTPDPHRALELVDTALEAGNTSSDLYFFRARVRMRTGQYRAARQDLETILKDDTDTPRAPMIRQMIRHARRKQNTTGDRSER